MFGEGWFPWIFIGLIFLLLIWNLSRRRRAFGSSNMDIAGAILADVNRNLKVSEERLANYQSKAKYHTGDWKVYKEKAAFLGTGMNADLDRSYAMAEDFNSRIDSARKMNSMNALQDLPVQDLKELQMKTREALVDWLKTNYELEQLNNPPRRGCL